MTAFDVSSMLRVPDDAASRLDALIRRSPEEVCSWRLDGTTCDDLPMEECRDLVAERATALLGMETLAFTVADYLSVIVPLAADLGEVDRAIRAAAAWIETLVDGSTADDVVHVVEMAHETGLLELTHDDFADDEGRAAFDAAIAYYGEMAERTVCKLSFSGRDASLILQEDGVVLAVQLEGADWAIVCVIAHHGDDGGRDDDHDPEPTPDPVVPHLVDA